MAAKQNKSIKNLPGWVWIYKDQEEWVTSSGKISTARHAKNVLTGDTLSVRDAQTKQKATRGYLPEPGEKKRTYVRRSSTYSRTYQNEVFGTSQYYYFKDIGDAYFFVRQRKGINPDHYNVMIIQAWNVKIHKNGTESPRLLSFVKEGKTVPFVNITGYEDVEAASEDDLIWERAAHEIDTQYVTTDATRIVIYAHQYTAQRNRA